MECHQGFERCSHEADCVRVCESFRKEGKQNSYKWARKVVGYPWNLLVYAGSMSWIGCVLMVVTTFTRFYYLLTSTLFLALTFDSSSNSKWRTVILWHMISITCGFYGMINPLEKALNWKLLEIQVMPTMLQVFLFRCHWLGKPIEQEWQTIEQHFFLPKALCWELHCVLQKHHWI